MRPFVTLGLRRLRRPLGERPKAPSTRVTAVAVALAVTGGLALAASPVRAQGSARFSSWTHPVFPRAEYVARHAAVLAQLDADAVLLTPSADGTSGGETFRQLDDFEYLTGLEVARSVLAIDGRTRRTTLYVPRTDARFTNAFRPNDFPGRDLLADASLRALSGVDSVASDDALDPYLAGVAARAGRVLIDLDRPGALPSLSPLPFTPPSAGELLVGYTRRRHAALALDNAYALMARLRMIKSAREIAALREAARVTGVAIARGAIGSKAGVDERTLAGAFTADCMALGAQRAAFSPIVKAGANSLWPWRILGAHYDRRNQSLHDGELVIFDVGCERDHYVSDVGRTFPVSGRFTPHQRELVDMVRRISDAVIAAAKPGMTFSQLQTIATAEIPEVARPYMQAPLYFGHHLGLSAGDPALADVMLADGMVFTIEPWYYNHDASIAVFLEDEILITPNGSENLTAALPRDAAGLEAMRNARTPHLTHDNAGRTMSRDGVLSFALDRVAGTVRVYDLLNGIEAATTRVCSVLERGELTADDVSFVVYCAGSTRPIRVNTASYRVDRPALEAPAHVVRSPMGSRVDRKTEVMVIGTIHDAHRTSARYGTDVLRRLLRAIRPDYVLVEIAPNRFEQASREFTATGTITEPRVVRFPEYVDVLFPLTRSMSFGIIPTAGWTAPMDAFRTAALRRIEADPTRRTEWLAYRRAIQRADSLHALAGVDNPYFIHSPAYDSLQTEAHAPYNRFFNSELGPGGWDNINEAHFRHIAGALDAHRGEGKRMVITYGAGHKEWFLRALRRRSDVEILEVAPFLRRIGAR